MRFGLRLAGDSVSVVPAMRRRLREPVCRWKPTHRPRGQVGTSDKVWHVGLPCGTIPAMGSKAAEQARVSVGRQGRVVIPARIREELGIGPGDQLVARVEEGRVVLEKRENVLKRVRARFARVPAGADLSEELVRERREESRREEREDR
jgi:AbrB family looped-hinge helix DNA binding protein